MSEELNQRDLINNPEKIGKFDFRNIGSTSLMQLKKAGIIIDKPYSALEKRKPDGIISIPDVKHSKLKTTLGIVENKSTDKFKTKKQKESALEQGLLVAQTLGAKFVIITDTKESLWFNAYNGESILDEKGREIKELFDCKNPDIEKLIEKIIDSVHEENSQLLEPRLKDPTRLARSIWQDLWMAAGATPENCLYSFVELFIFKYLSDLKVLPVHLNFESLMRIYDEQGDAEEALNYYAGTIRKEIKKLFKASERDNTTIINGTIFVSKDEEAVKGYGTVFIKILKKFGDEKEGGGELKNIDRDFKSKLFETFLKESISKKNWGQYFTPLKVVRAVAKMAQSEIKPGITLCDPACGVGKFLLEPLLIGNEIEDFFPVEKGVLKPKIKLIGIDKGFDKEEQKTIILAKANMLIYLSDQIRKNAGITDQFAEAFNSTFELKTKNILGTLRDVNYENSIDLILTNPPYVTTGSSNLKDEISKVKELKDFYKINAMGVEGLFMEWIIRSLKPNGKAFVVLPENILYRESDKGLRQFFLDECYIDSIISLPKKTFFSTIQKTIILGLTKKSKLNDIQVDPVFTYIVSEIGETRDVNRFDIDADDLSVAVESFNMFKGSKKHFEKHNTDNRCKIVPFKWFNKNVEGSLNIDNLWTKEEKKALGIIDNEDEISLEDFKLSIEDSVVRIGQLRNELDSIAQLTTDIKYIEKSLAEIFDFKSGNSKLTQSYINEHKGNFVVYSSNTKNNGIFGYIDNYDFDTECIQITTNGVYAGTVFYREKHKFSINGDARLYIKKHKDLDYKYLLAALNQLFIENKFSWENKPSLNKTKDLKIKIPVDKNNNYCLERQKFIADNFEKLSYVKAALKTEFEKYQKMSVLV